MTFPEWKRRREEKSAAARLTTILCALGMGATYLYLLLERALS